MPCHAPAVNHRFQSIHRPGLRDCSAGACWGIGPCECGQLNAVSLKGFAQDCLMCVAGLTFSCLTECPHGPVDRQQVHSQPRASFPGKMSVHPLRAPAASGGVVLCQKVAFWTLPRIFTMQKPMGRIGRIGSRRTAPRRLLGPEPPHWLLIHSPDG